MFSAYVFLLLLQALLEKLSSFQQPDVLSFHSMAMAMELDQRHLVIEKILENGLQAVFFWEFVWSLMMLKIYKIVKIASWHTFGTQSFPGGKET